MPGWALVLVVAVPALAVSTASGAGSASPKHAPSLAAKRIPVAAGVYQSLALSASGAVYAWGWNIVGQLGNGSTNGSDVPVKVRLPGGSKATEVSGGFAHSLAVTSSGAAYAWGKNYDGELGNGSSTDSDLPVRVSLPAGTKAIAVAGGSEHGLALTSTGAVYGWGYNSDGQLGDASTGNSSAPVSVSLPAGTTVTAIATGSLHSLALTSTGAVLAWGFNAQGELGDGIRKNSDVPVKVKLPAGTKVTAVAAGGYYSLALTSSGAVYAWGYNADGELGDGNTTNSDVPVKVKLPGGKKATAVAAGQFTSLAATSSGAVLAWGGNNFGELGDGSYAGSDVPVRVSLP
jgi:alpha-tubulin suppressor-like RCC1 family protein